MLMLLYDSPTRNGQTSSFAIIRRECNPSKGGGGGRVEVKSEKKKKGRRGKKKTERALVDSLSHRLLVVVHQLVFTTSSRNEKGRRGDPRWNSNFFPASMRGGGEGEGGGRGRRFEKFESTRNQKAEPHYKLKWNFQLPLDGYMVFYA